MKIVTKKQLIQVSGGESESFELPFSNEVMMGGAIGLGAGLVVAGASTNVNSYLSVLGGTIVGGFVGHVYHNHNNDKEHFSLKVDI